MGWGGDGNRKDKDRDRGGRRPPEYAPMTRKT